MLASSHDSFGRQAPREPAARKAVLDTSIMRVTRLSYHGSDLAPEEPSEPEEAFHVITQLKDFARHRLFRDGKLLFDGAHSEGALAITDLRERWHCHHMSPFDNIRFHISFSHLRSFATEAGRPEFSWLHCEQGKQDNVILGLAQALVPACENPRQASQLFLDQVSLAIMVHLTQAYGGLHFAARKKGTLAPWQERRATEFLAGNIGGEFSIAELAAACDLSRSYFIKAFKESFDRTPHRWLMEYRVSKARDLLLTEMPIVEIAAACGFADQSHFTRVFSTVTGEPPGIWRRRHRLG
ncbi:MAG: AraC family transcriptional regulator [Neorhizobium sp.]|nr:AraC family transcriptional regulator [Neorhizobium sp.]